MRARHILLLIMISLLAIPSCKKNRKAASGEYPMFWTWLDYRSGMNFDSVCTVISEVGIDGLLLNAPSPAAYREALPTAKKHGLTVYAWIWTMNTEHDRDSLLKARPEWFSVNRLGRSLADTMAYVDYYKFLCPAVPEVREYLNNKIKKYCEIDGLDGIALDYHRFVDVVLPTFLWANYGVVQDREYPEWDFGYHPEMIKKFSAQYGYDPRDKEDPTSDLKWRQFRCDQITEVANMFAQTIHSYGKKMGASPFPTPKMASRMVRQDWGKWDLDIVFPMVYTGFYTMDPSFAYDCTVENMRDKNPATTLYCGLGVSWEGRDDAIFDNMDQAFAGGAQGIAIFTVNDLKDPAVRKRFRCYTDSLRQIRSKCGGVMPRRNIPDKASADPFSHTGLMEQIDAKASEIAGHQVKLSTYDLVKEFNVTKEYEAVDEKSGEPFRVTFWFYGDIISGWDVKKKTADNK